MMKKVLLSLLVVTASCVATRAQSEAFRHYAVGVNVGTTGIGFDLGTTLGSHLQFRVGMNFMPKIKVKSQLDINTSVSGISLSDVDIEGKMNMLDLSMLLDYYPSKRSSFHLTAGFYAGKDKFVEVYNTGGKEELKQIAAYNALNPPQKIGLELGDYLLEPDAQGNVNAYYKVSPVQPYFGIGFGRAVPKSHRVGFMVELGVRYWGKPSVYCQDKELKSSDLGGDEGDVLKTMTKIPVYPCLRFRLCGKIL